MYYYGYSGGYGYNNPCCGGNQGGYVYPVNTGYGSTVKWSYSKDR